MITILILLLVNMQMYNRSKAVYKLPFLGLYFQYRIKKYCNIYWGIYLHITAAGQTIEI